MGALTQCSVARRGPTEYLGSLCTQVLAANFFIYSSSYFVNFLFNEYFMSLWYQLLEALNEYLMSLWYQL